MCLLYIYGQRGTNMRAWVLWFRALQGNELLLSPIHLPQVIWGTNMPICFWTLNCSDSESNSAATSLAACAWNVQTKDCMVETYMDWSARIICSTMSRWSMSSCSLWSREEKEMHRNNLHVHGWRQDGDQPQLSGGTHAHNAQGAGDLHT
jgi:hypothetical protein